MATLDDIKPSITELPYHEVFEIIKATRFSRRIPKENNKKAVKKIQTKRAKVTREVDTREAIKSMSKERRAKLIVELKEMT